MTGAVVLCAGAGSRLGGRAKAALTLPDGRTFLAAVTTTARAGGCARVVAVVAAPHDEESRAAALAAGVDEVLVNAAPEAGMISSLVVGLRALAGCTAALAWPVDIPTVRAATVRTIVETGGAIVVPRHGGRGGHPTLFAASTWPELAAAVGAPSGARSVLAADPARVVHITIDDPGIVLDVDTPEEYAALFSR